MQKFEILLNNSFPETIAGRQSETTEVSSAAPATENPIFKTQQDLTFQQEYFLYQQQNGVSIVNNLNVKGYLNNPKNESLAKEFLDYLSGNSNYQEFIDILYDDHKLSDYFNDYYLKFYNFSNQGLNDLQSNPSINLENTKKRLTEQDKLYLKTNSFTHYFAEEFDQMGNPVQKNNEIVPLLNDTTNFSGQDQSYYVNILIEQGRKSFFSDDFSDFYPDRCDGTITYNKYVYRNSFSTTSSYGNLDSLAQLQSLFNLKLGPSESSINNLRNLLPVNFLNSLTVNNTSSNDSFAGPTTQQQLSADQLQSQLLADGIGYLSYPIPTSLPSLAGSITVNLQTQILNFINFKQFSDWFQFKYAPYSPSFPNSEDSSEYYIYQQTINLLDLVNNSVSMSNTGTTNTNSNLITVPNLVGDPINDARLAADYLGFTLRQDSYPNPSLLPTTTLPGTVISQSPEAGQQRELPFTVIVQVFIPQHQSGGGFGNDTVEAAGEDPTGSNNPTGTAGGASGSGGGSGAGGGDSGGGGGGGGGCFVSGTKILLENLQEISIEDVDEGMLVLTYNEKIDRLESGVVGKLIRPATDCFVRIKLSDSSEIESTLEHPYFIRTKGWCSFEPELSKTLHNMNVSKIEVGDLMMHYDKTWVTVESIISETRTQTQTVYNFEVKGNNNYFANGLLVHNKRTQ